MGIKRCLERRFTDTFLTPVVRKVVIKTKGGSGPLEWMQMYGEGFCDQITSTIQS